MLIGLIVQYPVSMLCHNVLCLKSEQNPSERLPLVNYLDPPLSPSYSRVEE